VEAKKETHLSVEAMARWLARDLDHEEVLARIVPHLLALCPTAARSYEEVLRLSGVRALGTNGSPSSKGCGRRSSGPSWPSGRSRRSSPPSSADERFHQLGALPALLKEAGAGVLDPARAIDWRSWRSASASFLVEVSYDPDWCST